MERDFEKEFIELKLSEVPDLWNRIEAGLSEKKTVNAVSGSGSGYGKKYITKRAAWRKWGTLAAACLCVAIIYPMVSLVLRNMGNKDGSYSGSPANDAAESNTATDMTANQMAAGDSDMMLDAVPTDDSVSDGVAESFDNAGSADMTESAAAGAMEETERYTDSSNGLQSESAADKTAETENADITDMAEDIEAERKESGVEYALEDGQILEDVVVNISKVDTSGKAELYQAVVMQTDADRVLETEMQIELVCDAETECDFLREPREKSMLKAGENYTVSLRFEKQEGRFTVLTAARKNN